MDNKLDCAVDLMRAKDNIDACLSRITYEIMVHDKASEAVVEELLDETIKYLSSIQRRLEEINIDKGDADL